MNAFWYRIMAAFGKRLAAQNAPYSQPHGPNDTMRFKTFNCIVRASRVKAALAA